MAASPTIQRGTKRMLTTESVITIVAGEDAGFDTAVVRANTLIFCTIKSDNQFLDRSHVMWTLSPDGTTITVTRNVAGASGFVDVNFNVVEFPSGVTAQSVTAQYFQENLTAQSGTRTINPVDLAKSFIVACGDNPVGTTSSSQRFMVELWFNSATEVAFRRASSNDDVSFAYIVVQYDGCAVQQKRLTVPASSTTQSVVDNTLTPVTVANTALFGTMRTSVAQAHTDERLFEMTLGAGPTSSQLTYTRVGLDPWDGSITTFVVEFADGTLVEHVPFLMAAESPTVNVTIPAVELSRAVAMLQGVSTLGFSHGRVAFNNVAEDKALSTVELTTGTNALLTRIDPASAQADGFVQVIHLPAAVDPPTGLTVDAAPARVVAQWTATPGADGHRVFRKRTADATFVQVSGDLGAAATDFADTGPYDRDTEYQWSVRAFGAAGESDDSNIVAATPNDGYVTLAETAVDAQAFSDLLVAFGAQDYRVRAFSALDTSLPSAVATGTVISGSVPNALVISSFQCSTTTVQVGYTHDGVNVTDYILERTVFGANTWAQVAGPSVNPEDVLIDATAFAVDTRYQWRVLARGAIDVASNPSDCTPNRSTALAAPVASFNSVSRQQVVIDYTHDGVNVVDYILGRQETGGGPFVQVGVPNTTPGGGSFVDSGLFDPLQSYDWIVVARSGLGNAMSNVVVDVPSDVPAAATLDPVVVVSEGSVSLSWSTTDFINTFDIERRPTGGVFANVGQVDGNTLVFVDTFPFVLGQEYEWRIVSNVLAGSTPSNVEAETPNPAIPPAAPTGLAAGSPGSSAIPVTWVDNSFNEDGFHLEYSLANGGAGPWTRQAPPADAEDEAGLIVGLQQLTSYDVRVVAFNVSGETVCTAPAFDTASTVTAPVPPPSLGESPQAIVQPVTLPITNDITQPVSA